MLFVQFDHGGIVSKREPAAIRRDGLNRALGNPLIMKEMVYSVSLMPASYAVPVSVLVDERADGMRTSVL